MANSMQDLGFNASFVYHGSSYNFQLSSTLVKIFIALNTDVAFLFTFMGNPYVENRGYHISKLRLKDHRVKSDLFGGLFRVA